MQHLMYLNSHKCWRSHPIPFDLSVMYWAPTLALGGTLFALPKELVADFKQLFTTIAQLPVGIWTSTPSFADMAMLSDDFCQARMPALTHFYFDGEELTVSTARKLLNVSRVPRLSMPMDQQKRL